MKRRSDTISSKAPNSVIILKRRAMIPSKKSVNAASTVRNRTIIRLPAKNRITIIGGETIL